MDYKDIVKKISVVGVTDMFVRLKPFIFIPIISKTLGAGSYGAWTQIMITVSMLLPIVMLGMQFGLLRYLPGKSREAARSELNSVLSLVSILSFVGAIVLIAMSDFLSTMFFGSMEFSFLVKLGGVYLITMSLREVFLSYFRSQEKMSVYSILVFLDAILSLGLALWLTFTGYGVSVLLLMLILLNTGLIITAYMAASRDLGFIFPSLPNLALSKYLKYSLPFLPMLWLLWVMNSSDRYFLGYFKTMADVGIYSACYGISYFVVNMIGGPVYLVFQPIIMRIWNSSSRESASALVNNIIKYVLFLTIPAAFLFSIIAKSVIPFLTTKDFTSGIIVIPLILLSYTFYTIAIFVEVMIYLTNDTKKLLFTYSIPAVFNLGLNAILIPQLGMLGAGIATACSFALQFLCTVFVARRKGVFKLKLDFAFLMKVLAASLLMSIVISGLPQASILQVGFVVFCGMIIYAGTALLMKVFKKSEIEKIGTLFLS